jgi:acyl-CoA synthetase (AMP-forming)/AMP-acid ligase II
MARAAGRWPDRLAIRERGRQATFAELEQRATDVATALVDIGVAAGERVAIWAPNSIDWVAASLGIRAAGASLVPLNTRYKSYEANSILGRSGAKVLFTVGEFLGIEFEQMLSPVIRQGLERVVLFDGRGEAPGDWGGFLDGRAGRRVVLGGVTPGMICDVLYTSGTTGEPKGAMLRHEAACRATAMWAARIGMHSSDRQICINPFFHIFGLNNGILACLLTGATLFPRAQVDVEEMLMDISEFGITMLPGPPTVFQMLLDHPAIGDFDLSTLDSAFLAAASIPPQLVRRIHEALGIGRIYTGYGLTEICGVAAMTSADDSIENIVETVGTVVPDVHLRVVDDKGSDAGVGIPGEILIRTPNVMAGYLDDPRASAEAFDEAGYLRSGDIGMIDAQGYVRITDRKKDMFTVGGFNVYAREVENVLRLHENILDVAVVEAPDSRLGAVPFAFVVCRDLARFDEGAMFEWAREQLANFKVPRRFAVIAVLPMSATGKVLKRELRSYVAGIVNAGGPAQNTQGIEDDPCGT